MVKFSIKQSLVVKMMVKIHRTISGNQLRQNQLKGLLRVGFLHDIGPKRDMKLLTSARGLGSCQNFWGVHGVNVSCLLSYIYQ